VDQAFAMVGPAIARALERPRAQPTPDPAWSRYLGTYTWKHADVQVMVVNGELAMIVPDASNPLESRVQLAPIGPHTFRMVGGSVNGERLRFEVDESGKVTRLVAGSRYYLPKPEAR
jgi:hypothetical protein